MYLTEVDKQPLNTDLSSTVAEILSGHDVDYHNWYSQHLKTTGDGEAEALFRKNQGLFDTATEVVKALRRNDVVQDMESIADHPWVEIIEQGHHRREDAAPLFGPNKPE
jgi:hypothetical protein